MASEETKAAAVHHVNPTDASIRSQGEAGEFYLVNTRMDGDCLLSAFFFAAAMALRARMGPLPAGSAESAAGETEVLTSHETAETMQTKKGEDIRVPTASDQAKYGRARARLQQQFREYHDRHGHHDSRYEINMVATAPFIHEAVRQARELLGQYADKDNLDLFCGMEAFEGMSRRAFIELYITPDMAGVTAETFAAVIRRPDTHGGVTADMSVRNRQGWATSGVLLLLVGILQQPDKYQVPQAMRGWCSPDLQAHLYTMGSFEHVRLAGRRREDVPAAECREALNSMWMNHSTGVLSGFRSTPPSHPLVVKVVLEKLSITPPWCAVEHGNHYLSVVSSKTLERVANLLTKQPAENYADYLKRTRAMVVQPSHQNMSKYLLNRLRRYEAAYGAVSFLGRPPPTAVELLQRVQHTLPDVAFPQRGVGRSGRSRRRQGAPTLAQRTTTASVGSILEPGAGAGAGCGAGAGAGAGAGSYSTPLDAMSPSMQERRTLREFQDCLPSASWTSRQEVDLLRDIRKFMTLRAQIGSIFAAQLRNCIITTKMDPKRQRLQLIIECADSDPGDLGGIFRAPRTQQDSVMFPELGPGEEEAEEGEESDEAAQLVGAAEIGPIFAADAFGRTDAASAASLEPEAAPPPPPGTDEIAAAAEA